MNRSGPGSPKAHVLVGVIVALVGCVTIVALNSTTPEFDFVGHWRVLESTSFPKEGSVDLQNDGTARMTGFDEALVHAKWTARNGLLEISLLAEPSDPDPVDRGVAWRLRWKVVEHQDRVLHLEGPVNANWPMGHITLQRE